MRKFTFLGFLGLAVLMFNTCLAGSSKKDVSEFPVHLKQYEKKHVQKAESDKSSLVIPDFIKKNFPEEMQYTVFLQLILNLVRGEYVNDISEGEIIEKSIAGLLLSLDPHSSYLNEKTFALMKNQSDGEFGGLGIEIIVDDGFVRIVSTIDDTPAYKAGLKSADLIIYIDDECINGITSEEAIQKLRGKPGTKVKLKIKRGDDIPFDITVERDIIKIQSVKTEVFNNIGYIRISTFDKNTGNSIKKFLNDNKSKDLHGIILDVRNNPGGLLDEAVSVSDIFLDGGKIVSIKGKTKENTKTFYADKGDMTNGLPLVVLINSGTASASEIVAGALRDNKRAILVGERSFGKGSVQKVIPLSEKTGIKLTIAKYYAPGGECIQANGVTPDIEADLAIVKKQHIFVIREEFFNNALDADKKRRNKKNLDGENGKAIDELCKEKKEVKEEDHELLYRKIPLSERIDTDYQLIKAFDTIKTIRKFKSIAVLNNEKK
jgi:carboxyl-terminal processing protease